MSNSSIFLYLFLILTIFLSEDLPAQNKNSNSNPKISVVNGGSVKGTIPWQNKTITPPPVPLAACTDLGGDNGWGAYTAAEGYHQLGGSPYPTFFGSTAPSAPRFNLTSGAGIDPCTQGTSGPPVPVVCPGFGNASVQLGQPNTSGLNGGCTNNAPYPGPGPGAAGNGCSEQLKYPLTVTAQDTNFIYAYALILENPPGGHTAGEAPFAEIFILKQNGDTVPCSHRKYIADLNGGVGPGFFLASCAGSVNPGYPPAGMIVSYKPWTMEGVNLKNYIGQNLTVVITNSDCALGGHYCYSYWDFSCGSLTTNPASYCVGNNVTITAPSDPTISYTYQWYHNGQPYTGAPSGTAQTITPYPQPGDTFAVQVSQPSGCPFYITYVPQPMQVFPNFNYTATGSCNSGLASFTDSSYAPNGNTVVSWNWSFPGGTPSTSTVQNPTNISYPTGTYSVTLIVTSSQGCVDTVTLPVTVTSGAPPVASFSTGPVCLGATTLFSDSSTTPANDPLTGWTWDFGDGNTGNAQNPSHVYSNAGTYSVTLAVTTQAGCTHTVTQTVTVNPVPVPAFSSVPVCFNNPTIFNNQSTGGTIWNWNFGDGNTSTQQSPSHTYGAPGTYTITLIAENTFGCKDTVPLITVINPLPVASFSSTPVCLGSQTCFTDASSVTPGTVTGWSWNFGDPTSGAANTSAQQNPCHTFTSAGSFTVILTATSDSGCQSTTMLPANVDQLPTAGITPQNVCLNALTNFQDASTAPAPTVINGWDWNFGDGSPNSTVQNPSHTYATSGTYTITLIVTTTNGCKDTTANTVIIYNPPAANYTDSVQGCAPTCATFTDISTSVDGTVAAWQWSFPGGNPSASSLQNPTICWTQPGTYDAQLIVTSSFGCIDTLTTPLYINIYSWPTADFCVAPELASIADPKFTFCDQWSSGVTAWMWNFGDGSPNDSTSTDPIHNYSASVTNNDFYNFTISLAVQNQYGCWDTISKVIEILPEFTFYIPNTFTPNEDGRNDFFFGKGRGIKDYEIWLFDRWGNMLWNCSHSDKNTNWDGPGQDGLPSYCKWDGVVVSGGMDMGGNSGIYAQQDVYVWKVNLTDIFDKRHSYVGHVNIVR